MRLYGAIQKVEPLDDGTVRVHGIASTEAIDDQGEIVRASAMRAALPDYMRFPALREMHQLSAAGTTLEAEVGDDNMTRLVAHVVDPVAVAKVKNKVYRGFSIGGRVTQREAGNPKAITALQLNEISLVDRPANPEAIFDCWKASGMQTANPAAGAAPFNPPFQIWACGDLDHRHLAKAEALACLEKRAVSGQPSAPDVMAKTADDLQGEVDAALEAVESGTLAVQQFGQSRGIDPPAPAIAEKKADDSSKPYGNVTYADSGLQSDGKKRYPIDTEAHVRAAWNYINKPKNAGKYSAGQVKSIKAKIIAAWKRMIDKDGPPSAADKAGQVEFDKLAETIAAGTEKILEAAFRKAMLIKSLWDIGGLACMVADLMQLEDRAEIEAAMEGDDSSLPAQIRAACAVLCQLLRSMVAEETQEVLEDSEIDEPITEPVTMLAPMALAAIADIIESEIPDTTKAEALVDKVNKLGARHSKETQAQLDGAGYLLHRGMGIAPDAAQKAFGGMARKAVLDAGATNIGADGREMLTNSNPEQGASAATQNSTVDTGRNAGEAVPNPTGAVPTTNYPGPAMRGSQKASVSQAFIVMADAMEKAGGGHTAMYAAAHDLMCSASDGAACKADAPRPGHMSGDDLKSLRGGHDYLMAAGGVKCAASNQPPGGYAKPGGEAETQGTSTTAGGAGADMGNAGADKAAKADLTKLGDDAFAKTVADRFDQQSQSIIALAKAIETSQAAQMALLQKIHDAPMPPSAQQRLLPDQAYKSAGGRVPETAHEIADQLQQTRARAGDDEVTKGLIIDARRRPMTLHGFTDGPQAINPRRPTTE